jgi:hypothetical protein
MNYKNTYKRLKVNYEIEYEEGSIKHRELFDIKKADSIDVKLDNQKHLTRTEDKGPVKENRIDPF